MSCHNQMWRLQSTTARTSLRQLSISGDLYSTQLNARNRIGYPHVWIMHSALCTKTGLGHEQTEALWRGLLQGVRHELPHCATEHRLISCRFQQVVHTCGDLTHSPLPEKASSLMLKSLYCDFNKVSISQTAPHDILLCWHIMYSSGSGKAWS